MFENKSLETSEQCKFLLTKNFTLHLNEIMKVESFPVKVDSFPVHTFQIHCNDYYSPKQNIILCLT